MDQSLGHPGDPNNNSMQVESDAGTAQPMDLEQPVSEYPTDVQPVPQPEPAATLNNNNYNNNSSQAVDNISAPSHGSVAQASAPRQPPAPVPTTPIKVASAQQRQEEKSTPPPPVTMANLMDIVVGSTPKKRPHEDIVTSLPNSGALDAKPSASAAWESKTSPTPLVTKSKETKAESNGNSKRRRRLAPIKKVLVARKERDMANTLLFDKRDLAELFSREECEFLGKHFWMFTWQQLWFALDPEEPADPKHAEIKSGIRERMVKFLCVALASAPEPNEAESRRFEYSAVVEEIKRPTPAVCPEPEPTLDAEVQAALLGVDTESLRHTIGLIVDGYDTKGSQSVDPALLDPLPDATGIAQGNATVSGKAQNDVVFTHSKLYEAQRAANAYLATGVPGIGYGQQGDQSQQGAKDNTGASVTELLITPEGIREFPPGHPMAIMATAAPKPAQAEPPSKSQDMSADKLEPAKTEDKPPSETNETADGDNTKDDVDEKNIPVDQWKDEDLEGFKELAELKMAAWRGKLKEGLTLPEATRPEDRFKLDGAISFLMPTALKNFLASVPLKTLFEFMELKRTETGAVCDLVHIWRQKCSLPPMTPAGIAKHLLGVGTRMELAISSVPPVPEKDRIWVNDPIIVMTGASREFLIGHLNITSGKLFVEVRTKQLSLSLVEWRESRGMPPLKGSGKVAMISGWKATVKDAIEAEYKPGQILEGVDLLALAEVDVGMKGRTSTPKVKKETAPKRIPPKPAYVPEDTTEPELTKEGRYALNSPLLLEEALGTEVTGFLKSVNITAAAVLLGCNRKELEVKIIEGKLADDEKSAKNLLVGWLGKVRSELKQFEVPKKAPKKRQVKSSFSRKTVPAQMDDAMEALSTISQSFLATMDITTAEGFLTSRTTDIANEFVKFRIREGMPELKGLGAIASVSGWKAQCRKAAKNMGLDDIAKLEPETNMKREGTSQKPSISRPRKPAPVPVARTPEPASLFAPSRVDVLDGKSRRPFRVQSTESKFLRGHFSNTVMRFLTYAVGGKSFKFELCLRAPNRELPKQFHVCLTYNGSTSAGAQTDNKARTTKVETEETTLDIPILATVDADAPVQAMVDDCAVFSSCKEGAGCLSLSEMGVRPFEDQDLSLLKAEILAFILNKPPPAAETTDKKNFDHNVLLTSSEMGQHQYVFFSKKVFERGQIERLSFMGVSDYVKMHRRSDNATDTRILLDCCFNLLSKADLLLMAKYLRKDVFAAIASDQSDAGETEENLIGKLLARKRIGWVYWRLVDAHGSRIPDDECFLAGDKLTNTVPPGLAERASQVSAKDRRDDLESALSMNIEFSGIQKEYWCPLLENMHEKLLRTCEAQNGSDASQLILSTFMVEFQSEPKVEDCANDRQVWCQAEAGAGPNKKLSVDAIDGGYTFARELYRTIQLQLTLIFARALASIHGAREVNTDNLVQNLSGQLNTSDPTAVARKVVSPLFVHCHTPLPERACSEDLSSYQFFLGVVWPALRKLGWRLQVGETPDDIIFVTPMANGVRDRQSKNYKLDQKRKRMRLSSDAYNVGLGTSMKLTRRLCIATSAQQPLPEEDPEVETTVEDIADQYLFQLQESLDGCPPEILNRTEQLVKGFVDCFNKVAGSLPGFDVKLDGKPPSVVCGGEHLVQFLFILPTILRQSKLPLPHVNRALDLAQDVMAFVTKNYKSQLAAPFCPSVEIYSNEVKPPPSAIAAALRTLETQASKEGLQNDATVIPILTETVLPEDKPDLTDFVIGVMSQSVPCRATDEDMTRKYRRIHVGYPGLMCRHCKGAGGEGRYFFTSPESVATATTVFEKHLAKCTAVPPTIKQLVVKARERHTEQRKSHAPGLQQRFFLRLWERLRSSNIEGEMSGALSFPQTGDSGLASAEDLAADTQTFSDHLSAMAFVRSILPSSFSVENYRLGSWKRVVSLEECVIQYYNCIEYGGRVYGTPSMPKHYNAEWLLSKLVPRRQSPKRMMAG